MIQFLNIAGLGPILGRLWEQNLVLLIYGSYSEVSLPVLFMIILPECFSLRKRWREFAGDRRSLFGIDNQAGDAWFYGYSNDFGRIGVRCRTGGIIGKTDTGITGYDFWIIVVFAYHILATLLPVDKIIGKYILYLPSLVAYGSRHRCDALCVSSGITGTVGRVAKHESGCCSITCFPDYVCQHCLWGYLRISCYASPLMARCMTSERYGRPVFTGQ